MITPITQLAQKIAEKAHAGQFRRDGATPYIEHPAAAVRWLQRRGVTDEVVIAAAWLHDVVEDTSVKPVDLVNAGIPQEVVDIVTALTFVAPSDSQIKAWAHDGYIWNIARNPKAALVKIADIVSNLNDSPTKKQVVKYANALAVLAGHA